MKKITKVLMLVLVIALVLAAFAVTALAATTDDEAVAEGLHWKYTNSSDAEQYTADLSTAVTNAKAGTTIYLLDSYTLTTGSVIAVINKQITVDLGENTLNISQSSADAEIQIKTTEKVTFKNGTIHACANENLKAGASYGYANAIFRVKATSINLHIEDVDTYSADLVYNDRWSGFNKTGITINGGTHYMFYANISGFGRGILNAAMSYTVEANDATFIMDYKNSLMGCASYKEKTEESRYSTATFNNCTIIQESSDNSIIYWANNYQFFYFNNCDIFGPIGPAMCQYDGGAQAAVPSGTTHCTKATSENVVFGEGTRWNEGANTGLSSNSTFKNYILTPSVVAGLAKYTGSATVSYTLAAYPTSKNVSPLTGDFATAETTVNKTYTAVYGEPAFSFIKGGVETVWPNITGVSELPEVLLAADAGTTVTLLKDITFTAREAGEKEIMKINRQLTLDLNGKTLTLEQNGKSYFRITQNIATTIQNGTIIAYRTDLADTAHPIFRLDAGAHATINNVNTYSGGLALSWSGTTNTAITIDGGEHHKVLKSDVWNAFFETRMGTTVNASNASFYNPVGYFINDSGYNGSTDADHTYTFTNCDIIGNNATSQLLYYTTKLTKIEFNACNIVGSFTSNTFTNDANKIGGGIEAGAITFGVGTQLAKGYTAGAELTSLPEGYALTDINETVDFTLNYSTGSMYGKDFAIAESTKSFNLTTLVAIPQAVNYTYSATVGGMVKNFADVDLEDVLTQVDDGGVITLLTNATYVQDTLYSLNKKVTLNLAGYTLTVDQTKSGATGDISYISLTTSKLFRIENGSIIHTNSSAANNGKVFAFLHVGAVNAQIEIENVNFTGGAFIYNQQSKDVNVTITGGNYHMNVGTANLSGGIIESRNNITFKMSDAKIYLENNHLLSSLSYKALADGITPESTFTFENCDIYRPNATDNMVTYSNAYTTIRFDGCNIHGSIAAALHNFDKTNNVTAPTAENVILGEGTTIGAGSTASAVLAEGLGRLEDSGSYTFALAGASYTKAGVIADVSESKFVYTRGGISVYALSTRTFAELLSLVDKGGEIIFLDDLFIRMPNSSTSGQYAAISKGVTINLNGNTLYFSQSSKNNSFFKVNTTDTVTIKNGTAVWNINEDYVALHGKDTSKITEEYCSFTLFQVTNNNAVLNIEDLKAYGTNLVYSYSNTGITVNIRGGEYHIATATDLLGHALVDLRANATVNVENALIDLQKSTAASILSLANYKETSATKASTATFTNCYIIAKTASTNVLTSMNGHTTITFNGCYIYGSIKPTRHTNDNNQVKDANNNVTTPNSILDPVAGSIILGKGTYLTAAGYEKSNADLFKTEGDYVVKEASLIYGADIAEMTSTLYGVSADTPVTDIIFALEARVVSITFDLEVGTPPPAKLTVVFYKEDGTTPIVTFTVYAGETVTPPTYTPAGAGNGWYKTGFDGWATSRGSTVKVTDFTITESTNFYPAQTENDGTPVPYLTSAQYNLTFTGSLILNFFLPKAPDDVSNIRVTLEDGTPISYQSVLVNQGGQKVNLKLYEIANLSPIDLTKSIKIKVKFDVNGAELTQTVTLSAVRYAKKILADSTSASPSWSAETHSMIADMVRYSNELSNAAGKGYVAELETLLETYGKLCTPTNSSNDFASLDTSMYALNGYVTSVQFAISEFKPQWIINLDTAKKITDVKITVDGYYPLPDENGYNFGLLTYGVDEDKSTRSSGYLASAYIESMPIYNMDRDINITVTLEDGTEISGSYNLSVYYTGMNASGDTLYNWQKFLQSFRAFASSASSYRYEEGAKKENAPTKDFFDCDHENARSKAFHDTNGQYCDTCATYIFFYDSYITNKNYGGNAYDTRDAALEGKENSYAAIHYCHSKANQRSAAGYKAGCVATSGKVYYLGYPEKYNGELGEISVNTDTQWDGAHILSDESTIAHDDPAYSLQFFCFRGSSKTANGITYSASGADVTSYFTSDIKAGTEKLPFAPGMPMMLLLTDRSVAHYIRTGGNADEGKAQTEVILIDEFGNVSNTTPICWDYKYSTGTMCTLGCTYKDSNADGKCDTCTKAASAIFTVKAYVITDTPIKLSGLDSDSNISAIFENIPNQQITDVGYYACKRGITIRRSNVTIEGIHHEFSEDDTNTTPRQAYQGFRAWLGNNIVFKDMSVVNHLAHYQNTSEKQLLGSYEFSAEDAINVSFINCKVRNFFNSDGSLSYNGLFGTNGTRNMYLRDCFLTSFDSHSAAGNVTIENSTFEHLNFIGLGDIRLNNVTVYQANDGAAAIILRADYGSFWRGNLYIDGLELRYDPNNYTQSSIDLIKATYNNSYYGYGEATATNSKPQNVYANNVSIMQYSRVASKNSTVLFDENGKVIENTGYKKGTINLGIYTTLNSQLKNDYDYSTINSNNSNPMGCTENIYLTNSNVTLEYPDHPFFENMNVYIDGVEQNWYTKRDFSSGSSGGDGCVTGDTLVTLADGTQVRVDSLTGTEELLVWNFETGMLDKAPLIAIDKDPENTYEVIYLYFSDGTVVKVITEHGFFDYDLNKYVYLDKYAADYVGHTFAKQNGDTLERVELVDVVIKHETATAWSPVTAGHLSCFVNGMLSMPGGINGLFNIFDIDEETMTYDYEAMMKDIETYGLYTYEEVNAICPLTEEMFYAAGGAYLKVSIGKGNMTVEEMIALINRYSELF